MKCRAPLIVLVLAAAAAGQRGSQAGGDYALVWADEFNQDGRPDPGKWTFEHGFVRNLELQYYQPENARCEQGLLVIEARREPRPNPRYKPGSANWRESRPRAEYTSACLITKGLHSWLYGRFEMRARIPIDNGSWPAFWTLGTARPWPGGGEIDIMEYYRGILLANLIWGGRAPGSSQRVPVSELGGEAWGRQFHLWRMDWDRQRVRIWVDGRLLNDVNLDLTVNADQEAANPFREPHYMLVNLAIGGTQGGSRLGEPSQGMADPSSTRFPLRLEVDYIRVYQQRP